MNNKNLLIFILMTGVFGILNTEMGFIGILPYIAERYGVTVVHAGLLISLFALGVAIAGPTMPLFFSRFNRKSVMLLVLGLFTVCNVISVFAGDFNLLLAVRVLPAFFHPVYCSMAFTVAAMIAGEKDAPKAVAKINIGVSAGMVAGVPVSNFLAENISLSASMAFFAVVTFLVFLATWFFVPSMPATERMTYGSQLRVLKKPMLWASIVAVIFLNGSVFGVFNYMAEYLGSVAGLAPSLVSATLFVYGVCNIFGSMIAGRLLTQNPLGTVKFFPFAVGLVYLPFLSGGHAPAMTALLVVLWGLLGTADAKAFYGLPAFRCALRFHGLRKSRPADGRVDIFIAGKGADHVETEKIRGNPRRRKDIFGRTGRQRGRAGVFREAASDGHDDGIERKREVL